MENEMSGIQILILALGVLGTWVIAILAIWGENVRLCVAGPKLELKLHDPSGEMTEDANGKPMRYYHLKVTNKRRTAKAINVRVLVTKLLWPLADDSFPSETLSSPLHLTWQFPLHKPQFLTIGHNDEVCDLGFIPKEASFRLSPYLQPNKYKILLEANEKMRLELIAIAENARSNKVNLEISWNGVWNDDSELMKKNLVVKEIQL